MNRPGMCLTIASAALVWALGGGEFAMAQSARAAPSAAIGLGDVVVTARRKLEKQQSVPVAVSVLPQEALSNKGTFTPFTLQQTVPNFHVVGTSAGNDTLLISIRGQAQSAHTLFPSVIPYYAETPQIKGFSLGQFYDLENVQVLRGPQGVRFGRVTDGGAVLLSPRKPEEDFGGYVQAKIGDYSMHGLEGALNIPIVSDKVLLRAAFVVDRRDGYTENLVTGKALDDVHYDSERLSLIVRPFEGLENYTTAQYQNVDQNGVAQQQIFILPGSGASFFPGLTAALAAQQARGPRIVENGSFAYGPSAGLALRQQQLYVSNITTYDLNNTLSFKNVFGYSTFNQWQGIDDDGTALPVIDLPDRYLPVSQQRQISEEFQINAKLFDDRLNTTLGVYYDQQKPTRRQGTDGVIFGAIQQVTVGDITSDSKAVYGSFEYDLRDFVKGLKINGGMRYTKDKAVGDLAVYQVPLALASTAPFGICTSFAGVTCQHLTQESNATTWEAGASYQARSNIFVYAVGRRGYRGGGFNATSKDPNTKTYNPEYDTEVEVGLKADWEVAGMKARTNIALFRDALSRTQKVVTFLDANGISTNYTTNVVGATIQGVEFEGKLVPFEGLTFGLTYAFTDAQFEKDRSQNAVMFNPVNGICNWLAPSPPPIGAPGFCPYNAIQSQPKHTASFSAEYVLPLADSVGAVKIGGDYNYQSRQTLFDVSFGVPTAYQKSYGILNLHGSWENVFGRPIDLTLFATNVTDELYRTAEVNLGYLSNVGYHIVGYGEPRMFGASLKYRFGSES